MPTNTPNRSTEYRDKWFETLIFDLDPFSFSLSVQHMSRSNQET